MQDFILNIPYNRQIISRFRNKKLVVKLNDANQIEEAFTIVNENNLLYCIWLQGEIFYFNKAWSNIPLILEYNPQLFESLLNLKKDIQTDYVRILIKNPDYRVLENICKLAINDVKCIIELNIGTQINWSELKIFYENCFNLNMHFLIEPFNYLVKHIKKSPNKLLDPGTVNLNNPMFFLHINHNGDVSLTKELLEKGQFVSHIKNLDSVDIRVEPTFLEHKYKFLNHFIEPSSCSNCLAWRICIGHYSFDKNLGCCNFLEYLLKKNRFIIE